MIWFSFLMGHITGLLICQSVEKPKSGRTKTGFLDPNWPGKLALIG